MPLTIKNSEPSSQDVHSQNKPQPFFKTEKLGGAVFVSFKDPGRSRLPLLQRLIDKTSEPVEEWSESEPFHQLQVSVEEGRKTKLLDTLKLIAEGDFPTEPPVFEIADGDEVVNWTADSVLELNKPRPRPAFAAFLDTVRQIRSQEAITTKLSSILGRLNDVDELDMEALWRESGRTLIDFANALDVLREAQLVTIDSTPQGEKVRLTPNGKKLVDYLS